ncbi:translocation/assembly module TamB [Marivirga sp. S37H4]|uniref:Translocation/assembly module TamB n=1 Tax=Marivirga aurantiaca TaxID=2802615 RepID=A0A934WZZ6_9BACT|nr:translocation/assembly module TamB domain-containing protein [Marivirga aurantiaca]MBK6266339.1 translocation/assembly module TamB [Marivirga aurantiaca]
MKKEKNLTQGIKKGVAKVILWLFLILFFTLSFIVLAMQSSYVQTRVAQMGSDYLSDKLGFEVTISKINVDWFDQITISDLGIKNTDQSPFINTKELVVNYDIKELLTAQNILLNDVTLSNGNVMMIRKKGDDYFNIDYLIEAIRNLTDMPTDSVARAPKNLLINHIILEDLVFGIINYDRDSIQEGFNYNQFILTDLNAEVHDFSSRRDTIQMQIERLTAIDSASGLLLKNIQSDFEISQSKLALTNLKLEINESIIQDSLILTYNGMPNLSYFVDSVNIAADFKNTEIHAADLAYFAPYLKRYDEKITLSGNFKGKVKNFVARNLNLSFGQSSSIAGRLEMDGLPEISESFINFNLSNATLSPQDLKQYVRDSLTNKKLDILGTTSFSGKFIGFTNDFVANGVFNTKLGRIESDINLKVAEKTGNTEYKGSISTYNFDLGTLMENDSLVQKLQMTGNINGKGLTLATANLKLNANISLIGINGYEYQNITTNAQLAKEFFNGKLTVNDPLLKLAMEGSIDLRNNKNIINIMADLDTINLKSLNITKQDVVIKASGTLDGRGIQLDSIVGNAFLQNVYAEYRGNTFTLDTLNVNTEKKDGHRQLFIDSDLLTGSINGRYLFSQLSKDINTLVKEFQMNIKNDAAVLEEYYGNIDPYKEYDKYQVLYDLKIKKINPLIQLFLPELYISPGTNIAGSFINGQNSIFNFAAKIDSINFNQTAFKNNEIDLTFSKDHADKNVLGMGYVYSRSQQFSKNLNTENIEAELIWTGNTINFNGFVQQPQYNNDLDLAGIITFLDDSTSIEITQSRINALENIWRFEDNNLAILSNGNYMFENFGISTGKEKIVLNGELSSDSTKALNIRVDSFNVENVNSLLADRDYKGAINGFVTIQNYRGEYLIDSDIDISNFYIDEFLIGNISGDTEWRAQDEKMVMNFIVNRNNKDIVSINGSYEPGAKDNSLDLDAKLTEANLIIAEPFISSIFSDIRGKVNGEFKITGNLKYPVIKGIGKVNDGTLRVNYLNTYYSFSGNVGFDQDKVSLLNIQLIDNQGNLGGISGDLLHDGFTDLRLDLSGRMYAFNVLNTTAADNELYYGNANVSGDVSFKGPVNNLTIEANAKSEKGTRLFIPVESTSSVAKEDFIHFINVKDTANRKDGTINEVGEVDVTGVNLNFDLEITPDAYAEIIFDIKSGDIIRGRGNGKISLNIDSNGSFSMLGDYTLTEGGYNFTLYNIINKEFKIQPGSRISWEGDPYGGILDIKAIYEQNVSLLPIIDTVYSSSPELKRRYPAKVILDLQGDLLKPRVDFDIDITGYPDNITSEQGQPLALGTEMAAFKTELASDEQELKRQVFSLIILRRLSPRASFAVSGSVGNSVSEFLSNQLSYWVTQIDENLEIDVDFGSFDQEQFNTFQLRLSYSFLDGRLRVTRDGGFTQGVTDDVNQEILGILGDWSVEYLLSKDGKLRVKIYNRTNFNTLDRINNTASTSTGVSLLHVSSFNQIRDIFNKNKQKEEQEEEEVQEKESPQNEENEEIDIRSEAIMREEEENP